MNVTKKSHLFCLARKLHVIAILAIVLSCNLSEGNAGKQQHVTPTGLSVVFSGPDSLLIS